MANLVKIKPTRTCAKILKVRTYSLLLFSKSNLVARKPFMSRVGEGKDCPEIASWLELLEWLHFLIMSKNDSMNLFVGYVLSYNCCCHHRMDDTELLTYVHDCHLFRVRICLCLITARISDGGTYAQLSQQFRNGR
jgi:hypothetical protein